MLKGDRLLGRRRLASLTICFGLVVSAAIAAGPTSADHDHWSLRKRSRPSIPRFRDEAGRGWVKNPVDAFVLKQLRRNGLSPAPRASRPALVRRVYFNLTGLPPSPDQIKAFVNDPAADAFKRLVDELLASPGYGERFGQHWLDVVRFAETEGFEYDRLRVGAWRYRDYVIRSFNEDKPYDRFVLEQLAGDEIGPSDPQCQIAAGFHRLGSVRRNAGNQDVAYSRNEVLTDRTNVIGAVFLGLTVGCARCHDHKFDPIAQADYYRLQAYLASTFEKDVPLASPEQQARWKARNDEVKDEIKYLKDALDSAAGDERRLLEARLKMAQLQLPPPLDSICTVHNDPQKRTPIYLLRRGDPSKRGDRLGMRPLEALLPSGTPEFPADLQNPKTHLARWIIQPDHPLTARVMVNRIWQWHFGQGIVSTPNDFGLNGEPPSHPELLDYLANRFVSGGWRMKPLHRLILLSNAYRQSSRSPIAIEAARKDPEVHFLWRFRRRRLEAEEIRDAMLTAAGVLNEKRNGRSVLVPVDPELVNLLYKPSQWTVTENRDEHFRRSIYLIAKRNLRLPLLEVFDQPNSQHSCPRRESSTHAPQALELLNGRTSNQLADHFAKRLRRECGDDPSRQIERAFVLCTARPPTGRQKRLALAFLKSSQFADSSLREFALAMFNLNAFLYVD